MHITAHALANGIALLCQDAPQVEPKIVWANVIVIIIIIGTSSNFALMRFPGLRGEEREGGELEVRGTQTDKVPSMRPSIPSSI